MKKELEIVKESMDELYQQLVKLEEELGIQAVVGLNYDGEHTSTMITASGGDVIDLIADILASSIAGFKENGEEVSVQMLHTIVSVFYKSLIKCLLEQEVFEPHELLELIVEENNNDH